MSYTLPDPWIKSLQPVCGVIRPTSSFSTLSKKPYRSRTTYLERASSPIYDANRSILLSPSKSSQSNHKINEKSHILDESVSKLNIKFSHPTSTWGSPDHRIHVGLKKQLRNKSIKPGFTFTSQSFIEKSDDFGLKYRRVKNKDGYPLIVPVRINYS